MAGDDSEPDSPDSIDLTQGEGHWLDRGRPEPIKGLEEMTPEEIHEKHPEAAETLIEELKRNDESVVAQVLSEEQSDSE